VHWASDATALCRIVTELLAARGARRVVKSKSMLTEECGLNPHLAARGIDVVDTDLGERIVQLAEEKPSHLIVPAIHKTRREIGALFHRQMGTPEGEDDP
jgi:L-lactate dehydrogenase complex protein LldF